MFGHCRLLGHQAVSARVLEVSGSIDSGDRASGSKGLYRSRLSKTARGNRESEQNNGSEHFVHSVSGRHKLTCDILPLAVLVAVPLVQQTN